MHQSASLSFQIFPKCQAQYVSFSFPPFRSCCCLFLFGTLQFSSSTVKYTKPSTTISEMFFALKILYCIVSALKASCKRRKWWRETSTSLSLLIGRIIFLTHEKTSFAILIGRIFFVEYGNIARSSDWLDLICV